MLKKNEIKLMLVYYLSTVVIIKKNDTKTWKLSQQKILFLTVSARLLQRVNAAPEQRTAHAPHEALDEVADL